MRVCILSEYLYPDNTGGAGGVISKLVRHPKDEHDDLERDVIAIRNTFQGVDSAHATRENWNGIGIYPL